VLNSLQNAGAGFGHDTNKISIIKRDGTMIDFDLKSKQDVAMDIVEAISKQLAVISKQSSGEPLSV
jgi:phosphopantothenoylcysteine decarboxylase / phosphopantothenate---cysteine ligase